MQCGLGAAGEWGGAAIKGGGGAGTGVAVSLLCHIPGVESTFSQLVSFVTSHLSLGEVSSPPPPPNLAVLPVPKFRWNPSLLLPTTPVHQLYLSAPGKGVVWKVEICVGTLPLWGLWLLRLLPGPLLDLQFPQLVEEDRHHAFAFSEGCPALFPHIAYPRPCLPVCVSLSHVIP